jgi:hypothetical protein
LIREATQRDKRLVVVNIKDIVKGSIARFSFYRVGDAFYEVTSTVHDISPRSALTM